MFDLSKKYSELLGIIREHTPFVPETAIVLGSGLGDFADKVNIVKSIETTSLPEYPKSTVEGHKGYIHFARHNDKTLLLFQGRIHLYEGYRLYQSLLPAHIAVYLGARNLIVTNAAGGINLNFKAGDLMLTTSFNSLNIKNELTGFFGIASEKQKSMLLNLPAPEVNGAFKKAALDEKIELKKGVYILAKGPSYETPSEIKMYGKLGNDAVGMSTVHEAIYGAVSGLNVGAVSLITNLAAGISPVKLSHKEVIETADKAKDKFERLVKRTIELL